MQTIHVGVGSHNHPRIPQIIHGFLNIQAAHQVI